MKLSVTGSHSTGKTCLVDAVGRQFVDLGIGGVSLIGEVARKVIKMGFPLNQDATVDSYLNYIWLQLQAEHQHSEGHVVSDRSLVDLLAYIRTNKDPKIPHYFVSMLEETLWLESRFFDLYCYLPVEFPLVLDDVRPADLTYQKAVDASIRSILEEYRLPYRLITGDLEHRCKRVVNLILTNGRT